MDTPLARMAREDPTLLAHLLLRYQVCAGMQEAELAAFLGCTEATLPYMGLCLQPRMDTYWFRTDIEEIAAYAGVNATQLAIVVRTAVADAGTPMASSTIRADACMPLAQHEAEVQQAVGARWHAHRAVVESATSPAWADSTTITGDAATLPPEDMAVLVDSCAVAVRAGAVWHSGDRSLDGQPWHVGQVWRTLQ